MASEFTDYTAAPHAPDAPEDASARVRRYLEQGIFLDRRIAYDVRKLRRMRAEIVSLSAPLARPDRVQASPAGDAPFVRALEHLEELEEQIQREVRLLADLRAQIRDVISQLDSPGARLVLSYRYLEGLSWPGIGDRAGIGASTARRWHADALRRLTLPPDPIFV